MFNCNTDRVAKKRVVLEEIDDVSSESSESSEDSDTLDHYMQE